MYTTLNERIAADRIQESRDRAELARRARQLRASHRASRKDQAGARQPRLAALVPPQRDGHRASR